VWCLTVRSRSGKVFYQYWNAPRDLNAIASVGQSCANALKSILPVRDLIVTAPVVWVGPIHLRLSCRQRSVPFRLLDNVKASSHYRAAEANWNEMAHVQKPDFVFRRNGWVHLNRRGRQFSRLLADEVCASAVVMLDTPCSEVVWRVLATHSIGQFPLHFPSLASPCAITFQLDCTSMAYEIHRACWNDCHRTAGCDIWSVHDSGHERYRLLVLW